MFKFKRAILAAGFVFSSFITQASAQDALFPVVTSVESNYIALGAGFAPDYYGSDDYTFGGGPAFRFEFGDHRNIEVIGNYATMNLINHDALRFGPMALYRFGRDDDIDDRVVGRMKEIDNTLELGAFISYNWFIDNDIRHRFKIGLDIAHDVTGEHEGLVGTTYARYWAPVSKAIDVGIGGTLQYGGDEYANTYFGVDAADSAASGLPRFNADGGIVAYKITPAAVLHLSENWHVGVGVQYSHLVGDPSDSPVVSIEGDENQFIGGLAVAYSWGSKVNKR
jgi:outer membrane protein